MKAGFAEIEITPPLGTRKIGWIKIIEGQRVADPLYARVAVFTSGETTLGFIQLDLLSTRWEEVVAIRSEIQSRYGIPGQNVMICATHNHGGPAIATIGDVLADEAYVQTMAAKVVSVFGQAFEQRCEAEIGAGRAVEFHAGYNRRVIQRSGIVKTHGHFSDPEALCLEGPIDPEVFVLAARTVDGKPLGALVNFACHPAHHGGDDSFSAGWPGVMANALKAEGWNTPMFLNGAAGNISTSDPSRKGLDGSMEEVGQCVAQAALRALAQVKYTREVKLGGQSKSVSLPYRRYTADEVKGTLRGAQRFVDPAAYDRGMPKLLDMIAKRKTQAAEVLTLSINEFDFVAIPAEPFVELGLRIKEQSHPRRAVVVGYANGMVGYVPHAEAFTRGGYETTFCNWSRLAPEAGDILVAAALDLIGEKR